MNMRIPCQYTIMQFLPYPETGEFANVGIVLACPQMRYLGVRLAPVKRTKRITDFFDGLDAKIYRESLRYVEGDLKRLSLAVLQDEIDATHAFGEIVRPREAIIRCGDVRAIMASAHPAEMLESLYLRFVERDFATKEYHETVMKNRLESLLDSANLRKYYSEGSVGDDIYPVKFPFVSNGEERGRVVIKPLNLTYDEPYRIFEHGNSWIARILRLKKHNKLPSTVLFAVDEKFGDEACMRAASEIKVDLQSAGALVEPINDSDAILEVARRVS